MSSVVDAHHHLLDPARFGYPWLTPELAAIDRRFGPDDLASDLAAAGIDRTILVQTIGSLEETRDFLATAAEVPFIGGVIGWVDLTDRGVTGTLESLRGGPGGEWLVGIRHQVHDEPDPDWLLRPDVRRGLAAIEAADLAYDLLVRPRELPAALIVAREMAGLRFVIDHLAKPPIRSGASEPWARLLRPFGELPNVSCKLSGLVTEADPATWQVADLAPYVEVALEAFGPGRLLFGSDWPVCLLAARDYAEVFALVEGWAEALTDAARAKLFGANAARVYGIG